MVTRLLQLIILLLCLINMPAEAQNPYGQTIQITTRFKAIIGKPTWLIEVRDVNTGLVTPYLFDITNQNNFWLAFTYGHEYRITASTLKYGRYAILHNFCGLEDGILTGKSLRVVVSGVLAPDPDSPKCYVMKYTDSAFVVVEGNASLA